MYDTLTTEELIERFHKNEDRAEIALQTAREYEKNSPWAMHESGGTKFSHYLSLYYDYIFENENIARVLSHMGNNEFMGKLGLSH